MDDFSHNLLVTILNSAPRAMVSMLQAECRFALLHLS
jgi:hypothetical protein